MKGNDPTTFEEWQDAANAAEAWLRFDSAKKYGLISGGPDVDVDRCDDILKKAKRLGITPNPEAGIRDIVKGSTL